MADGTKIEWTDATWNPITGCSVVSPGCTNCYAMKLAGTRLRNHPSRAGLTQDTKAGPVWTGEVRFNDKALMDPLRWTRPRMIFVVAHGDLFAEQVPDEWIDRLFAVMALCPRHIFQVLTKRPERMRDYFLSNPRVRWEAEISRLSSNSWDPVLATWPLPNVWLGVSVEDQKRANERIPLLLDTPAAVRWISAEPLLGPVDLNRLHSEGTSQYGSFWQSWDSCISGKRFDIWSDGEIESPRIDWVVAGGESGPGARPSHPDWFRSLRDQCAEAAVPFLFKQWGNWAPDDGPLSEHRDPIMDGAAQCAIYGPKGWQFFDNGFQPPIDSGIGEWVYRIGKKDAGRYLDGVLHDGFPTFERNGQ